jgi:aspartate kinase
VCIDFDERKSPLLIRELKKNYRVLYNENTELITIRHYNEKAIAGLLGDRIILLEQKSRLTAQFVVK